MDFSAFQKTTTSRVETIFTFPSLRSRSSISRRDIWYQGPSDHQKRVRNILLFSGSMLLICMHQKTLSAERISMTLPPIIPRNDLISRLLRKTYQPGSSISSPQLAKARED